jgi:CzcA family heavy metal efflux pump
VKSAIGRFAVRHATSILFLVVAICVGGAYCAVHMPSSVFPQANFPRVVIMVDNGVMPADEMMASITRPIEEAVKEIPGCRTVRSATGRGSAQIDVFFTWDVDMVQSELYVSSRISELRASLPGTANVSVYRMTFSVFPIIGISLTSPQRDITELWETARYQIKPQFLRIPGVASVDIVGGRAPEYHVVVDPFRLSAARLTFSDVVAALRSNNVVIPTGLHEEKYSLYLTVVDGRLGSVADIENLTVPLPPALGAGTVHIKDFATVSRGPENVANRVTADGVDAVLLNIYSQPGGSTLEIADQVQRELASLHEQLPGDMKLRFFYDQSLLVRGSMRSVWEAIGFGLLLSVLILYLFLKNWGTVLVAIVVIPVAVLFTVVAMKFCGMSFNLMTLGGIGAAIGLIIDDAIVVVESIYAKIATGLSRVDAVQAGLAEIFEALLGSTLTPVVVFIPLAFLDGITGVFFRALALTMAVSMLTSLLLAVTLTPSLAAKLMRPTSLRKFTDPEDAQVGGLLMRSVIIVYERTVRLALDNRWFTIGLGLLVLAATVVLYGKLNTDFLPAMDEGGFVIDYTAPPGTSLSENNRQLLQVERILKATPEVESFSRRTGTALGVALVEPNTGDFLVKLKPDRKRSTADVVADLRLQINTILPRTQWAFPGILTDLIGDLTWSDEPVELKIFSNDIEQLKKEALHVQTAISAIPGVVDTLSGLVYTGPTISIKVRYGDTQHFGLTADSIATAVNIAMGGQVASTILEADRVVNVRVNAEAGSIDQMEKLRELPLRSAGGAIIRLRQVADLVETPGELELHRDDLRQDITVTSQLENRDLGSAMAQIRDVLGKDKTLPAGSIEYGGLYEQQQESFHNLLIVLVLAIVLVFMVALLEFRSFYAPIAIVFGAVLSVFGIVCALLITHTTLSIVAFLGAIIGMGIVHKNGILMLDYVEHLRARGLSLHEALVYSGRRRLRPVLMTSLAAAMGMLPLAYGIGSGTDMLRPMAIAVIGAVCISVLLSLVVTPTAYYLMLQRRGNATAEFAEGR